MFVATVQAAPRDPAAQAVSGNVLSTPSSVPLERICNHVSEQGLCYAGGLAPAETRAPVNHGDTVLADVRTAEKWRLVGRVPDALHAAWQTGPTIIKNPCFLRELEKAAPKSTAVLLLCRNGKRPAAATETAAAAGLQNVSNMLEDFEGDLDEQQQHSEAGGWRRWDLP